MPSLANRRSRRADASDLFTRLGRGSHRRGVVRATILGIVVLLAALVLLAIPMRRVPGQAAAAKAALTDAKAALQAGDVARARRQVASARDHVDAAESAADGVGGHVWSLIPFLGTPVSDARNLVHALDDATSVAEVGTQLYPAVAGEHATLFRDGQVDEATLAKVIAGADKAADDLASAQQSLDDVHGSTPFVGASITARRDAAAAIIDPLANAFTKARPMVDRLHQVLGFEGERHYLVAMLNPAELRYSGGAVLNYAPLTIDDGKMKFGASVRPIDVPRLVTPIAWRRVRGNHFHRYGKSYIAGSTYAPSWSVSGEELLRAWHSARGQQDDGLIAVDVVGLSQLFQASGDINLPGYGTLTAANLVKALIGSYDQYYPDATVQDAMNKALIPAFEHQFIDGGNYLAKVRALGQAADGRHFALYMRDHAVQDGVRALGVAGDLATPDHDYLGVFTQNTTGSKVDYYQRRNVSLDVTLAKDGSAQDRLDVVVDNDTPPYAHLGVDPKVGYFTRWSGLSLGVFLPDGVQVDRSTLRGQPADLRVRRFFQHQYVATPMTLAPTEKANLQLSYRVDRAATVDDDGRLSYQLSVDPQGMVNPQTTAITVHLPAGYHATAVPAGWIVQGDTLTVPAQALTKSQQWKIVASPDN